MVEKFPTVLEKPSPQGEDFFTFYLRKALDDVT